MLVLNAGQMSDPASQRSLHVRCIQDVVMLMPVQVAASCSCSFTMQQKVCITGLTQDRCHMQLKCLHYEYDFMLALADVHNIKVDRYACDALACVACT